MRKPAYYKTPLRTRAAIMSYIRQNTSSRYYHYTHPFCFDVKCYHVNLDFDTLLKHWRHHEDNPLYTHNEEWLAAVKERYSEIPQDHLWEWGIEDACNQITDSDCYDHLWDGTPVDVEYSFEGRSGGWLSINSFEGYTFASREGADLEDMDFPALRKFYQLVVMLTHDLEGREREVEYQAAFNFFANACNEIPQPDTIQKRLFAEEKQ